MAQLLIASRSMALALRLADVHAIEEHSPDDLDSLDPGPDVACVVLDVGDAKLAVDTVMRLRENGHMTPVLLVSGYQHEWADVPGLGLLKVGVVPLPITRAALLDGIGLMTGHIVDLSSMHEEPTNGAVHPEAVERPVTHTPQSPWDTVLNGLTEWTPPSEWGPAPHAPPSTGPIGVAAPVAAEPAPAPAEPAEPEEDRRGGRRRPLLGARRRGRGSTEDRPVAVPPQSPNSGPISTPAARASPPANPPATPPGASPAAPAQARTAQPTPPGATPGRGVPLPNTPTTPAPPFLAPRIGARRPVARTDETPPAGVPSFARPQTPGEAGPVAEPDDADEAGAGQVEPQGEAPQDGAGAAPAGFDEAEPRSPETIAGGIPVTPAHGDTFGEPAGRPEPTLSSALERRLDEDASATATARTTQTGSVHIVPRTADLVRMVIESAEQLYGVADTAQVLADDVVERADADAAAVLVPDEGIWRVSGGVGLRPLERRLQLEESHWLVREIASTGRAVLIEDTDIIRQQLAGAPLAAWRHLLAVPIPDVRSAVVLARGQEAGPFTDVELAAVVPTVREAATLLTQALETRRLARLLGPLRELEGDPQRRRDY